jgi:hypothetical protein
MGVKSERDVLVAYLCRDTIASSFHHSMFELMGYDASHNHRLNQRLQSRGGPMGLVAARNELVKGFLKTDNEWMFCLDDDMGFEPIILDQLLSVADAKERPVMGGLCFVQREIAPDGMYGFRTMPSPTIFDWIPNDIQGCDAYTARAHYPMNQCMEIGATGAACLLIHRSVVNKLHEKFGDQYWDQLPQDNGVMMGEDISFCDRVHQVGVPVWVHTGIRLTHYKHTWVGEDDFWQSFIAPPATERVSVIVPVLHRPQNVKTLMESLTASTGLATAWFVCDPDDIEEQEEVRKYGGRVLLCDGTFAHKVNTAYKAVYDGDLVLDAPWILLVGDDVRFRPGWLDQAQDVARRYVGADVIGTNDLANARVIRGEHATHPMIRRSYIDELGASWDGPGIIAHEGYHHWFVDDEIITVAKSRQAFQAAHGSEVEHMHPIAGKAQLDGVYALGQAHIAEDAALFRRRLAAHGGRVVPASPATPPANRAQRRAQRSPNAHRRTAPVPQALAASTLLTK